MSGSIDLQNLINNVGKRYEELNKAIKDVGGGAVDVTKLLTVQNMSMLASIANETTSSVMKSLSDASMSPARNVK
jgi:hypothetical protein